MRLTLTPTEAASLLVDGAEEIHTMSNPNPGIFIGCGMDRADAIADLGRAEQLEMGGPACQSLQHPLVVWMPGRSTPLFFQVDMAKFKALEAKLMTEEEPDEPTDRET